MAAYRTICITGANRGLGLEFVRLFLQMPTPPQHLIAFCRNPDDAVELKELGKTFPKILHTLKLDITEVEDHERAVREIKDIVGEGGVNLLINNAGIMNKQLKESILAFTKEELLNHFNVNVVSPLLLTKAFHPVLKQGSTSHSNPSDVKKSVVVFISSRLATFHINLARNHPYRIAKAGLNMGVQSLALEWKEEGILVTALHPGWVKTDMGGPNADVDISTSVSGMVKVILDISEKNRAKLYQYDGQELNW